MDNIPPVPTDAWVLYKLLVPSRPDLGVYFGIDNGSIADILQSHKLARRHVLKNPDKYIPLVTYDMIACDDISVEILDSSIDYSMLETVQLDLIRNTPEALKFPTSYEVGYSPFNSIRSTRIQCNCGSYIMYSSMSHHLKTKLHHRRLEALYNRKF